MDERNGARPIAWWFWVAAAAAVLFMAVGCWGYLTEVTTDPVTLPLDQRNLMEARPTWMTAAYAVAVWTGLLGALLLVLRRKAAEPLLLVSLIAALATFLPYAVITGVRDLVTSNDIAAAVIVLLITGTIYSFARHSRQRGWLH